MISNLCKSKQFFCLSVRIEQKKHQLVFVCYNKYPSSLFPHHSCPGSQICLLLLSVTCSTWIHTWIGTISRNEFKVDSISSNNQNTTTVNDNLGSFQFRWDCLCCGAVVVGFCFLSPLHVIRNDVFFFCEISIKINYSDKKQIKNRTKKKKIALSLEFCSFVK